MAEAATPPQMVDIGRVIKEAAERHHINYKQFLAVANCEDPGFIVDQQSNYVDKQGKRERSFGIFQINIEQNPSVTYDEAINPFSNIEWSAEQWEQGNAKHWTCYRMLYK